MIPIPFEVGRKRKETQDVVTLTLKPRDDRATSTFLPAFLPGQFSMLYAFGAGEVPISISGSPEVQNELTYTIRSVGAVTRWLNSRKKGEAIGVRGPFGSYWPLEESSGKDVILIAGGLGLAPLRSVIYTILIHRSSFGRVSLLYGSRTPEDVLYHRELEKWGENIDVHITVDVAPSSWKGHVGVVTKLISRVTGDAKNTIVFICGPEIMMRFSVRELGQYGVSTENIFLAMERNMKCATGFCGHCQFGPTFVCKDGPIFRYDKIRRFFETREI